VTLALANPALWYLLDRTKPGFTLSLSVGLLGTAALLLVNPEWVPAPSGHTLNQNATTFSERFSMAREGEHAEMLGGVVSYESVGVATWIASVLFCSCVCFGNIGRMMKGKNV